MKILLIGEYSRFHNSLKNGLMAQGHDVVLVGDGDQFKDFPVDISTRPIYFSENFLLRKLKNIIYRLTKFDLLKVEQGLRYLNIRYKLKGFDIVQLVNSDALFTYPWLAKPTLKSIFKNNKHVVLSACGDDTPFVDWLLKNEGNYDILTPLKNNTLSAEDYKFTLKYIKPAYRKQYNFVEKHVSAIIPTDMDYVPALQVTAKVKSLIPTPINISEFDYLELPSDGVIHIFHGINEINYHKKGNAYFEKALDIIKQKYSNKVKITTARSLPYDEYITSYNSAHILLDQVFSYDQAYNALEAMAKGKVVFSGAERSFYDHYKLDEPVCINAKPDVDYLVAELSKLIDQPQRIETISKNARNFVENYHSLETVSNQYLEVYKAIQS